MKIWYSIGKTFSFILPLRLHTLFISNGMSKNLYVNIYTFEKTVCSANCRSQFYFSHMVSSAVGMLYLKDAENDLTNYRTKSSRKYYFFNLVFVESVKFQIFEVVS